MGLIFWLCWGQVYAQRSNSCKAVATSAGTSRPDMHNLACAEQLAPHVRLVRMFSLSSEYRNPKTSACQRPKPSKI